MTASPADDARVPVVVGAGQAVDRDGATTVFDLAEAASRQALSQAPSLAARVQRLSFVDALSRTGPAPASALATRLGLAPAVAETTTIGGETPQRLVTRAAADIADGGLEVTLIAGGEAVASRRRGHPPAPEAAGEGIADPVVGDDRDGTSPQEAAIDLRLPAHVYPMLESAMAARLGRDHTTHRARLGELMAPFTDLAATHPIAWFPHRRSAADIATPGPDNPLTAEPYTRRMNAMLAVDQGAALLVTSLAAARRAGVEDRAVFVWSGADATDLFAVPARPDLAASPGLRAAAQGALAAAGLAVDELAAMDLYSCFPIAVEMACDALGLAGEDPRWLTVTGGLPYFGGPGNNYATHAIATLTDRLREHGGVGMVTGLGWFATKHAAGIYGATRPPDGFRRGDTSRPQAAIDASAVPVADEHGGPATVDAATVVYASHGAVSAAPAYLRLPDGRRLVAAADPDTLPEVAGLGLVGAVVHVEGRVPAYRVVETTGSAT